MRACDSRVMCLLIHLTALFSDYFCSMTSALYSIALCQIWICYAERSEPLMQQIENQCLGLESLGQPRLWAIVTNRSFSSIHLIWASSLGSPHLEHTSQFLPWSICSLRFDLSAIVAVFRRDFSVVANDWKRGQSTVWLYWGKKLQEAFLWR